MSGVHIKISDQGDYLPGTTERYEHLVFHFKKCVSLLLFNVSQAYKEFHIIAWLSYEQLMEDPMKRFKRVSLMMFEYDFS